MGLNLRGEGGAEVEGCDGEDGGGYVATVGNWGKSYVRVLMGKGAGKGRRRTCAYAPLFWEIAGIGVGVEGLDLGCFGEGSHGSRFQWRVSL